MVNVDQQHNLPTQTQNKGVDVRLNVTLLCGGVYIVDMGKQ